MKNAYLCSFALLFLFYGCTNDSDVNEIPNVEILELNIKNIGTTYEVDKLILFEVSSNQNLKEICISTNNWLSSFCKIGTDATGLGMSKQVYLSFDKIGTHTINVKIQNLKNEIEETSFQINIEKGNSVKIKSVKVISFKNINGSWDTEYANDNINRLADVIFSLEKNHISSSFDAINYNTYLWYRSSIKENQGDLTWDLSAENLYIDPNLLFKFGLGDDDTGGIGEDLLLGPPFSIDFELKNFIVDKPSKVTLKKNDIELEVLFELEW